MLKDRFSTHTPTQSPPANTLLEITPDDNNVLDEILIGLNVEAPGRIRVTTKDGTTGTVFVAAGIFFPLRVTQVWATGTTATGIRGFV